MAKRYRPNHNVNYDYVDYSSDLGLVEIPQLIAAAEAAGTFTFDLETTGLDPFTDRIEGIAFYVPQSERFPEGVRAWYPFVQGTFLAFDRDGKLQDLRPPLDQRDTFLALRPLFSNPDLVAIAHHGKFDAAFLRFSFGADDYIEIDCVLADSMLCDYVADERHRRYGLKIRVKQIFGVDMTTYEEAVRGQTLLPCFNAKPLAIYAMDDAEWSYRIHRNALASIRAQSQPRPPGRAPSTPTEIRLGRALSNLEALYWGIALPVSRVIMEMQTTGVLMDYRHLRKVTEQLEQKKRELHDRIESFLGWPLNVRSGEESASALFDPPPDGLGLPTAGVPIGKSGLHSTSDRVVRRFIRFHPLVQDLLEVRSIETVLSSYARKMLKLTRESHDGRLRSNFNQTGTKIGRLSCVSGDTTLSIRVGYEASSRSIRIADLMRFAGECVRITTHTGRERKILHLIYKGVGRMYEVSTDDGSAIRCTAEHRFYTERGWRPLKDIRIGDRLLRAEVCAAAESNRNARPPVGAGPPIIPQDLCGGSASDPLEDPILRAVERDRRDLQSDLRLGVSRAVLREIAAATSEPAATPPYNTYVDPPEQVEGLPAEQRVVPRDLCRQRSDAGGSQAQIWCISPSDDHGGSSVSRVCGCSDCEAWTVDQRVEARSRDVFREGPSSSDDRRGADDRGNSCAAECEASACATRRSALWDREVSGQRNVMAGSALYPRDRVADCNQSGHGFVERRHRCDVCSYCRNLSAPGSTSWQAEGESIDIPLSCGARQVTSGPPDLFCQSIGDAPIAGPLSSWHPALSSVCILQESSSRLCVAPEAANGGDRRCLSREVHGDASARPAQGEESPCAGLQGAAVHDRRREEPIADGSPHHRGRAWTRVAGITPAGVDAVWDIEVEEDHSYIAHGLVNHNSSKPINQQSMPRDKDLIRKSYCAYLEDDPDPQDVLVGGDYSQVELRVAASLSNETNMLEVYRMGSVCRAESGSPCDRFTWCECKDCGTTAPPIVLPDGKHCPKCASTKLEHQARCAHVDLHQRTSELVNIKRNPLAKNCVTGDSMVLTEHGLMRIDEVVTGPDRQPNTTKIVCDDGKLRPLDSTYAGGEQDILSVEMEYGLKVRATPDHEFFVMEEGKIVRRRADLLKPGDATIIMTGRNIHGTNVDLPDVEVAALASYKDVDLPKKLTPEVARFFGYLVSEGRIETFPERSYYQVQFGFAESSKEMIQDFLVCTGEIVGSRFNTWRDAERDAVYYTITAKKLNAWLDSMGFGHSSAEKNIPRCVRSAPWALKREFLRAYFEGDGTNKRPSSITGKGSYVVSCCSKSETLIRQIHAELANVDILGFIHKETRSTDKGPQGYWLWSIRRQRDLARFRELVGFVSTEKQAALDAALATPVADRANRYLDNVEPLLESIYIGAKGKQRDKLREVIGRADATPAVRFGDTRVELLADILPEQLQRLIGTGVWTAKIQKVEPAGRAVVYDLYEPERTAMVIGCNLIADCNFGLLYRMAAPKFCIYANLFDADGNPMVAYAAQIIAAWHNAYPAISVFHQLVEETLPREGWVAVSLAGRRRRLDREAQINPYRAVTQGVQFRVSASSQDLIQIAMKRNMEERDRRARNGPPAARKLWARWRALLQVHDELVYQCPREIADEVVQVFKHNMETADSGRLGVPLVCEPKIGRTWDDIH